MFFNIMQWYSWLYIKQKSKRQLKREKCCFGSLKGRSPKNSFIRMHYPWVSSTNAERFLSLNISIIIFCVAALEYQCAFLLSLIDNGTPVYCRQWDFSVMKRIFNTCLQYMWHMWLCGHRHGSLSLWTYVVGQRGECQSVTGASCLH